MATFTYTARALNGQLKSATIEAKTREEVVAQLRKQKLTVVKVDEQTKKKATGGIKMRQVVFDVESGHTVADALRKHPKAFTELYTNMVAAGEAGGILDTILLRLAVFLEKNDALVRKVKGAMIYPGVILSVAVIAVGVLLLFVIPVFEEMFASVGMALPLPTRVVIGMSKFLKAYWWAVGAGIAGLVVLGKRYYASNDGRRRIDGMMLRRPVLG